MDYGENRLKAGFGSHFSCIVAATIWLMALMLAINSELVLRPLILSIGSLLGVEPATAASAATASAPPQLLVQWCTAFVSKLSYIFVPLAVGVDTFLVWMLLKNRQMGRWLPVLIIHERKPRWAAIVVSIAALALVVGTLTGIYASAHTSETNIYRSAAAISFVSILLFAFAAKYCSLLVVDEITTGEQLG